MGAGFIFAPKHFTGDLNILDYSIRTWNIGPDQTDDIEREYRRHRPINPMVFKFYINPSGGIDDGGKGFNNMTGKSPDAVIEFLHREDNRLHDGREDIKVSSALDELKSVISNFEPKIAHDLSWVKGQKGKGVLLHDGKMITWPVNRKQRPDHLTMYEYFTGHNLPETNGIIFMEGLPFDIDEEGNILTLKETPEEMLADISKIDYRLSLKESKTAADFWVPGGDVNMGYQAPDQGNPEYDYDTDKFRLKPQKEMMDDIDVGIENLNENELKQAVSNAIRIALLSPKQPLHGNAMVYQALLDVPYTETDPQPYIDAYKATKQKYDEGEDKFMAGDKVVNKMPSSMTRNLIFCAKAAEHLDGAVDAARKDLEAGGDGHIFRNWTMANITGMAGKTASFAWLLLNPNKSNLATVDTHMFRSLYPGYDELNTAEREAAQKELNKGLGYFMYERIFDARSKALGYPEGYKLGPTQWNFWDTIRSGESQPHDAFRTIDPTPAAEATWTTDAASGSAQDISQVVPDWNQTQGAGMEVQNQFDQFHTELLQEAIKAGIFSAAKQYLSPEDIDYISQVRPDILNGIVRQASVKKEFTKEDAFDLMDKLNLDFDGNEFWMGMNDELEHDWLTHGDPEMTARIVSDHLSEYPDYYSRLHETFKKEARPADPEWWGEQSQEDPYVYHVTSGENLPSIAEAGLIPWNETDQGTRYKDELVPRPDHIYFSTNLEKANWWHQKIQDPFTLRVKKDYLAPQLINPDEDAKNLLYDYNQELESKPDYMFNPETDEPISLGEYAEMSDYGYDTTDTRKGIEDTSTIAYYGNIDPRVIEYQEYENEPWQPITNLLEQQLTAQAKAAAWDKPIHKLTRAELEYIATR